MYNINMITEKTEEQIFVEIYENGPKNNYDLSNFSVDFPDLYNYLSKKYIATDIKILYSVIKAKNNLIS